MTVGGDLSSAVAELARLDASRLTYGQDYSVDLQVSPCSVPGRSTSQHLRTVCRCHVLGVKL